jgi:hypothetical protein
MAWLLSLDDAELGPIRPGRRFLHRRVIEAATGEPMLCEITRITMGHVWWRPADRAGRAGRARDFFELGQISRYVLRMADQD